MGVCAPHSIAEGYGLVQGAIKLGVVKAHVLAEVTGSHYLTNRSYELIAQHVLDIVHPTKVVLAHLLHMLDGDQQTRLGCRNDTPSGAPRWEGGLQLPILGSERSLLLVKEGCSLGDTEDKLRGAD